MPPQHAPKKSLGQNFLRDANITTKIVDTLELSPEDTVIEIGPGYGQLTEQILPRVQRYVGIELDNHLAPHLQTRFGANDRFTLIHGDFWKFDLSAFVDETQPIKLVGNVPYHITSPIIFKIIDERRYVETMTLMIQKEVAQRIVGVPRTKDYGILSVLSQAFSVPEIRFNVSRHVFKPKPRVESAVVQWRFAGFSEYAIADEKAFMRMVKLIFGQRRKMLRNSLKLVTSDVGSLDLEESLLKSRPEDLSVTELIGLWTRISESLIEPKLDSKRVTS